MSANKTKWVQLGDYIELCDERNSKGIYNIDDVRGMTITKEIIPTKADLKETDLSKFLIVKPKEFVYNPRTHGKKIGLGYNNTKKAFIISWNNIAFHIKKENELIPDYLYMIICREEWDRNACFRSWGSSTEVFSWNEFKLMEIPLPPIEVQQELVDTYNGLKSLAEQNEALIEPLRDTCEALTIKCLTQSSIKKEKVGNLITFYEKVNVSGLELPIYGINKNKTFMPTVADTNNLNKAKYKLVSKNIFAFSGMQTGRDVCIRIAYMEDDREFLISPAYTTFKLNDLSKILPQFFFILFCRFEMDRLGWFLSDGSIRSNLDLERFCDIEIPLPPIEVQQSIVNLYHCMEEAKKIASEAREKLKEICPALIQKAIHQ